MTSSIIINEYDNNPFDFFYEYDPQTYSWCQCGHSMDAHRYYIKMTVDKETDSVSLELDRNKDHYQKNQFQFCIGNAMSIEEMKTIENNMDSLLYYMYRRRKLKPILPTHLNPDRFNSSSFCSCKEFRSRFQGLTLKNDTYADLVRFVTTEWNWNGKEKDETSDNAIKMLIEYYYQHKDRS
jgi:hypothetical protein